MIAIGSLQINWKRPNGKDFNTLTMAFVDEDHCRVKRHSLYLLDDGIFPQQSAGQSGRLMFCDLAMKAVRLVSSRKKEIRS
jgi:hypothetical protein